jgi:magnesium chelatase family protein
MVTRVKTVAFAGIEARIIDVQVQVSGGLPAFTIVGLADKAVGESRERIRAALHAIGLALPPRRITVNLAPADMPKEGSHYDLPIALALLSALGVVASELVSRHVVIGELALDGGLGPVAGTLPAALAAAASDRGLICPISCGAEAAWAGEELDILAPANLIALINHFKGTQMLSRPERGAAESEHAGPDLADIRGQEQARRALEVAAAGAHNLLMIGPPGAGKSMLAERLPSILPPLSSREMLEVSMVLSLAGTLENGKISSRRPFRNPHHSASPAAIIGGGLRIRPGEVSLAHKGVLFLDELPEFAPRVLEALRQPMESGEAVIARANSHVTFPARFQLVAAMNPCHCGMAGTAGHVCARGAGCEERYRARLSGPLLDRIDLTIEMPAVNARDLVAPATGESSAAVRARVARAREIQLRRFEELDHPEIAANAEAPAALIEDSSPLEAGARTLLGDAADRLMLSARSYFRVIRIARTLADLDGDHELGRHHIAEALAYRGLEGFRRAA